MRLNGAQRREAASPRCPHRVDTSYCRDCRSQTRSWYPGPVRHRGHRRRRAPGQHRLAGGSGHQGVSPRLARTPTGASWGTALRRPGSSETGGAAMTRLVLGRLLVGMTALAAIACPAVGGAQPATVSAPAAGVTATWSRGETIDPFTGRPSAVSCPTAKFCAAVTEPRRPLLRRRVMVEADQHRPGRRWAGINLLPDDQLLRSSGPERQRSHL